MGAVPDNSGSSRGSATADRRRQSRLLVLACLLAGVAGCLLTYLVEGPAPARSAAVRPHLEAALAPGGAPSAQHPTASRAGRTDPRTAPSDPPQQLLTVSAPSARSTRAWVQRWTYRGGRWVPVARPVPAEIGAAGLTRRPVEGRPATPVGLFTITDAFGAGGNAGHRLTRLAYRQVRYGDSWGSDPHKATYNRLWNCRCSDGELYRLRGSYFRYGLVIDVNRSPVVRGAGSGFFLHVTDGHPTGGCVAMPAPQVAATLRWLDPAAHPRILIRIAAPGLVPRTAPVR